MLTYILICVNVIHELARALQAGSWNNLPWNSFGWSNFFEGIISALVVTVYLASVIARARSGVPKRQLYTASRILRFVATSNDESLAPPATWLLDELRNEPVPAVPSQFERLPPITETIADAFTMAGSISCIMGGPFAIIGSMFALASSSPNAIIPAIGFAIGGLVALLLGVVLLRIARRVKTSPTVSAEEIGLRWTPAGRDAAEVQIRWRDARSFFLIQYSDTNTGVVRHVAFVLDAPDVTLIWDERTTNKPEVLGISDSLCALILARTGLPLRDLTGIAGKLASPRWEPAYASLPAAFWQPLPGDDPTLPTLPHPVT
ncbi:MAG TPA: hypothetical protein VKQ30_17845 [Ktedonobacterales bacterium]|nr:hypothetical protein [Ktedonobacterales bacterium]